MIAALALTAPAHLRPASQAHLREGNKQVNKKKMRMKCEGNANEMRMKCEVKCECNANEMLSEMRMQMRVQCE